MLFVVFTLLVMLGYLVKYPSSLLDLKSNGNLLTTRKNLKEEGFLIRGESKSIYREVWEKRNMLGSHYAELNLSEDLSSLEVVNIGYNSSIPLLNRKRYMEKPHLIP